jgi:hypothetical protein
VKPALSLHDGAAASRSSPLASDPSRLRGAPHSDQRVQYASAMEVTQSAELRVKVACSR